LDRDFKRHLRKLTNIQEARAEIEKAEGREKRIGKEDPDNDSPQEESPDQYQGGEDLVEPEEVDPDEVESKLIF
jgi:hypothetical protein